MSLPQARAEEASATDRSVLVAKKNQVENSGAVPTTAWQPAEVGLELAIHDRLRTGDLSQASVRLTNLSVLQIDELTTIEILPPRGPAANKPALDLKAGQIYFFSRDKPREIELQTPLATGALQGTEFNLLVGAGGRTVLTMLDGVVELRNALGRVVVNSGEQGLVEPGRAPTKTAAIYSTNIIQWCLYYPGLLDTDALRLDPALSESVSAYRAGDLLEALRLYPRGRTAASSDERAYRASLLLAVGRVREAERLTGGGSDKAGALRQLIAAVKFQEHRRRLEPSSATEWLAESYYRQSRNDLPGALVAAQTAVERAPHFGFAWVRVASLQFSFGRVREAAKALERGRALSPRNAQAAALAGFFASAENNIAKAAEHFDEALAIDGFLGNAWLGRGLCKIRRGHAAEGRRDLQVAAAMEPNRALLHSYVGKAFSNAGDNETAGRELNRSREIDPSDPTPWLYSALLAKQEHHFNGALDDLNESLRLNDNRSIYRSNLLLDQDRAVRNANLASIYQEDGLTELSLRVASRAVTDDYANSSAHLFLANSYNALRDPSRILLRFDTPFFNELLLANLLSPVGGGPLSQNVSDQEYSKLFERDRFGVSTNTVYLSEGQVRELGSQFGQFGNFSYAVDVDYESDPGTRPNYNLNRLEIYSQAKYQLGLQDSIFIQTKYQDNSNGDVFQYYDQNQANRTRAFHEKQEPLALIGYHHEWSPGVHTLLLASRLVNDQTDHLDDAQRNIVLFLNGQPTEVDPLLFTSNYASRFTIYAGELTHIWQTEKNILVLGGRAQMGNFETRARFDAPADLAFFFNDPAADQSFDVDYRRFALYGYETFRPFPSLSATVGFSYDDLVYPANFRNPPLLNTDSSATRWSPKLGVIWKPWSDGVLRASYTRSLGGISLEDSVRLEPTLVGGFNQALRTLIPESIAGTVDAARDTRTNFGFEQKFGSGTYLAVEASEFSSELERSVGLFDATLEDSIFGPVIVPPIIPSASTQKLRYTEKSLLFTANQLVGAGWSLGATYRINDVALTTRFPDLVESAAPANQAAVRAATSRANTAFFQEARLFALYNDPSGLFARAEAIWTTQNNEGYSAHDAVNNQGVTIASPSHGADFWQLNFYGGYRFPRNLGDVTVGLLNVTDQDYRLNPLNEYAELPRSFTVSVQARLNF
ncbi:MAG: FecR domain-containing protein [Verrucomicrobiota bacterium]|nr:FecR domain-containing protein [Verrucomicrobiota bacterium]